MREHQRLPERARSMCDMIIVIMVCESMKRARTWKSVTQNARARQTNVSQENDTSKIAASQVNRNCQEIVQIQLKIEADVTVDGIISLK